MFYCERCKNTGRIEEQYVETGVLPPVNIDGPISDTPIEIKTRKAECPQCLGFGAAGWALPG